jgi:hypothetical protein
MDGFGQARMQKSSTGCEGLKGAVRPKIIDRNFRTDFVRSSCLPHKYLI